MLIIGCMCSKFQLTSMIPAGCMTNPSINPKSLRLIVWFLIYRLSLLKPATKTNLAAVLKNGSKQDFAGLFYN